MSISTNEVLVAISARGNGSTGKFEVSLVQGKTERAYDAVLTGRGELRTDDAP